MEEAGHIIQGVDDPITLKQDTRLLSIKMEAPTFSTPSPTTRAPLVLSADSAAVSTRAQVLRPEICASGQRPGLNGPGHGRDRDVVWVRVRRASQVQRAACAALDVAISTASLGLTSMLSSSPTIINF